MGDEFNKFGAWEEAWQKAFDGSEHTPPGRVWQGLENSLMEQQLRRYKRKLWVYQWLAAASVMLLGIWVGLWLLLSQPQQERLSLQPSTPASATQGAATAEAAKTSTILTAASEKSAGLTKPATSDQLAVASGGSLLSQAQPDASFPFFNQRQSLLAPPLRQSRLFSGEAGRDLPGYGVISGVISNGYSFQEIAYATHAEAEEEELLMALLPNAVGMAGELQLQEAEINREIRVVANRKRPRKTPARNPFEGFWVGASVGRNTFDPNMNSGDSYALDWTQAGPPGKGNQVYTANVASWDQLEESVPSLDFRIDAAYRISRRWMVQSGLQYNTFKVKTLTGTFTDPISQKSYPLYYSNFSNDRLQTANVNSRTAMPITALTSYNFLSVPLSLNFVLFERQFGLALSSGVSSEIFMGGQIRDQYGELDEYKIEAGAGSPFRKVHLNAMMGAQLFYRVSPRHIFTLEPSYRHAISDFHKSNYYFDSRPKQFGIAAGFRFVIQ